MEHFLNLKEAVPTAALIVPTVAVIGIAYTVYNFTTRISPTIPYAGEETLSARLQVPVEYSKDPVEFLRRTRKKLGDVFCVDLFAMKVVFILGSDGNREILRAAEDKISFWEEIKWLMGPVVGEMVTFPGWIDASMRIARTALSKPEKLQEYMSECVPVSDEFFENWATEDSIPLFESISELILSYLIVILVGKDFYRRHGKEVVPLMARYERELQKPILRFVPFSMWRFTAPGKFLSDVNYRFDELIRDELQDIYENPEKNEGRTDYFYFLVTQLGSRAKTFEVCFGTHIASMVFGGHANAAMTIPWMFLHARQTPGALARIQEEAVLGPDERKPYIEACLRETGRLYTSTTIFRMIVQPVTVRGHYIPKGTVVSVSPAATQRADADEDKESGGIYERAAHWDPERFLKDPDAYTNWFKRGEFVQFGLGVHACPGEKLARIFIFDLVLKTWMERYDVEVVSGLEEGVKGLDGIGADAAWTEENFGTPSIRGSDVQVRVRRKVVNSGV